MKLQKERYSIFNVVLSNQLQKSYCMLYTYKKYPFTPILGWSISRYELFSKCKRQYFYTYYSKYCNDVPTYKINQLKALTSVPLETGNVLHDILEAFLNRLKKSDARIDEKRFFEYAESCTNKYFAQKRFIEIYYGYLKTIDMVLVKKKIETCLKNFIDSSCYSWIFMAALHDRNNWIIEPDGYGETRLDDMKVYCKMDFLLPVDGSVHIIDWKTGKRDEKKHSLQLTGYAAAASELFHLEWKNVFPRIAYLYPEFNEFSICIGDNEKADFYEMIRRQTKEMYSYCSDVANNIPVAIDFFPKQPFFSLCRQCRFRELCFPEKVAEENGSGENLQF